MSKKGTTNWPNPHGPTPEIGSWWRSPHDPAAKMFVLREGSVWRVYSRRKRTVVLDIYPKMLPPREVPWQEFTDEWKPSGELTSQEWWSHEDLYEVWKEEASRRVRHRRFRSDSQSAR